MIPPSSKPTENTIFSARIALGSKGDDLINWSTFTNNLSTDYEKIFKDILGRLGEAVLQS